VSTLRSGAAGEGYGVCDNTGAVAYFDYADYGDSGNWGAPTLVSRLLLSVKIARTTSDGVWTLTQTITPMAGTQSVRVIMALKNNTAVPRSFFLMRFADVDVSGTASNNFDATANSAFGWNSAFSSTPDYGLMVQKRRQSRRARQYDSVRSEGGFSAEPLRAWRSIGRRTHHRNRRFYADVLRGNGTTEGDEDRDHELQGNVMTKQG